MDFRETPWYSAVWQYEDASSKCKGMCDDFKAPEQAGHFKNFFKKRQPSGASQEAAAEQEAWSVHSSPTPHACSPVCIPDAMKLEHLRVNRGDGCGNAEQGTNQTRLRAGASYREVHSGPKCQSQGLPLVPLLTG